MLPPWRRPRTFALAATILAAIAAPAGVALGAVMNSRSGRAEYKLEARALDGVHTITVRQSGGAWIDADQGNPPRAGWYWLAGRAPSGFVRAHAVGTVGAGHGRVLWSRVELIPNCKFNDDTCMDNPVVIVSDRSGTFFAYGTLSDHTCFGTATGPYAKRGSALSGSAADDDFDAPRSDGANVKLTYSFPYGKGRITETDTIARSTDLPRRSFYAVSAIGHAPAFTSKVSYRYSKATAAPKVNRCQ